MPHPGRALRNRTCVLILGFLAAQCGARSLAQSALPSGRDFARSLPTGFERNEGQTDPAVRYLTRGPGYSILFREHEADIFLAGTAAHATDDRETTRPKELHPDYVQGTDEICMHLVNASMKSIVSAGDRLPGIVNYFVGNDASKWHGGIATFGQVEYTGVYPGIDVVYYGNSNRLEFDYRLAPDALASDIRLHFDGVKRVQLDRNGDLVLVAGHGRMKLQRPAIYQTDAAGLRQDVRGGFRVLSGGEVGFRLGRYDHNRPLIIDPILDYSTYLGAVAAAASIAVDAAGEAFVAGSALAGLPTTAGSYQPGYPPGGKHDNSAVGSSYYTGTAAFVAKLNSTGTALLYCTYLSGSENDAADAIAIDAAGNAFVAGATASHDFPVTTGAFQTSNLALSPSSTGFITELDPSGSHLVYSTFLGGSREAVINGLAIDGSDNVFVTGYTSDLDFPITPGAFQTHSPVAQIVGGKGFVSKLAAGGKKLVYSTYLGGTGWDLPYGIALDAGGNAYVTGGTQSPDFPTTPGAFQTVNKATIFNLLGGSFVTKLNPAGTALVYSTFLDGSATDVAYAIAVDAEGSAYVTGDASSQDFPTTPGVIGPALDRGIPLTFFGSSNVFVTKLNPAGSGLVYSTFLGGTQVINPGGYGDTGYGVAVDSGGNAYVTGSTQDIDFPVTEGALQTENISQVVSGDLASFVTKLNPTATKILYSTYFTGSGDQSGDPAGVSCDCAAGIALDSARNVYIAGRTVSTDLPTTQNAFQNQTGPASYTGVPAFVAKFNAAEMQPLPLSTTTVTASPNPQLADQPITFTATVRSSSGSTPTGTVSFTYAGLFENGTPFAFGPWNTTALDSTGTATFTTDSFASGSIPVVAYYLGDAKNAPSRGSTTENVDPFPTTTTITADLTTAAYGTPVTFTATVVETATGKPVQTGVIFFAVGSTIYDALALDNNGQAAWVSTAGGTSLPVGRDGIAAEYFANKDSPGANSEGSVVIDIVDSPAGAEHLQFIPITPCRVADTRKATGAFGGPELAAGATREFDLPQSACGIPTTALAYSLNITVAPNRILQYLTLWPSGTAQPYTSTLNSYDGRVKANAAITPAGSDGGVSVFVSDASNVIIDINGYFVPAGSDSALAFYPLTPCRIADTRSPAGPLGGPSLTGHTSRSFPVLNTTCGIPLTAQGYSLNVTTVPHGTLNYLTTWPTGETQPDVSTLNALTGAVTANAAIVPAGDSRAVSVFVSDDADVVLDINGYFAPAASGGLSLYTAAPCRVVDTRGSAGPFNGTLLVPVQTSTCAMPAAAQAYVLNATVVPPMPLVYLTLWPDGRTQPYVSTLNADDEAITSNLAIVPTSDGNIDAFSSSSTNVILDVSGYFAP